jgi:hypothetical protein
MKFYNPYKPHIVTDGTRFAIRKRVVFLGWEFFDVRANPFWWYADEYINRYCWCLSFEEAKKALQRAIDYKPVMTYRQTKKRLKVL